METKTIIAVVKQCLFISIMIFLGVNYAQSVNDLNKFTTMKSNDIDLYKSLTMKDLIYYNELITNRFEYGLLFVATLVLYFTDINGLAEVFLKREE